MSTDSGMQSWETQEFPATCVHEDGTEHPAPSEVVWDEAKQRWLRMYSTCDEK